MTERAGDDSAGTSMPKPDIAGTVTTLRMRWNRRMAVWMAVLVVLCAFIAGGIAIWARGGRPRVVPLCRVGAGSSHYVVNVDQAANATTITAVAERLNMPDHAVTIALATALQESKLLNVRYGDRDSLGLFQQRPSQGWGTPAQIMDPQYSSTAFFQALARVSGWQTMSVTSAAQAVQHSNAPDAYARWAPTARALAIATTGEVPAGLACQFSLTQSNARPASPASALSLAFGPSALDTPVPSARGWTIVAWLVGHAEQYRITSIRFGDQEWTPRGIWSSLRTTDPGVRITQTPPA
jgi:hypothetical protein